MKNLQGKRVLVCGGATGIGAAVVQRLTLEGARVGVADLNIDTASALAEGLRETGQDVTAWEYDQASEASVNALVAQVAAHFDGLDGLFANVADIAAVQEEGDLLTNELSLWQRTVQVNLLGTVALARAALPAMLAQGSGAIVMTSSDAAVVGEPLRPAYAASKAGVNSLCRHIASAWGRQGIRCNIVSPGFVLTQQLDAHMPADMKDQMLKGARSPRHGRAEDVAGAVSFLLSDEGEWVNGQCWRVNGGVSYAL
ncbi:MAG: SDR family oxidoreductase [Pseudomonadota bacterium]